LDLKREASEVWFVGPVVKDLAKNNLAQYPERRIEPPRRGCIHRVVPTC